MEFDVFVGGSGKKLTDLQKEALADFGVSLADGAIENKSYALVTKWLEGVVKLAKQNLANANAIASNALAQSITVEPITLTDSSFVVAIKAASNALAQSITVEPITLTDSSFVVAIKANDYWKFVDLGVKGAVSSSRAPNSPFRFKGNPIPIRPLQEWIAYKGIPLEGRDKQAANRSFAINIARKISREGLRATNFMSNAATKEMVDVLTENIAEVLGKSISVATVR